MRQSGQIDGDALGQLLMQQWPQDGSCLFLLDGSSWPGPRCRGLEDLQYVYQAASDADGGNVTVSSPCLLLQGCAEAHSSWSLSLEVRGISSQQPAQDVGVEHIRALDKAPQACLGALDLVAADGKYGNRRCLSCLSGLQVVA